MIHRHLSIVSRLIAPLLLVVVLAVSLFPINALADDSIQTQASVSSGNCGNCSWEISNTGTLSIKAISGTNGILGPTGTADAWIWNDPKYLKQVTSAEVRLGVKASGSLHDMFVNFENMKTANLSGMDTTSVTDMKHMFNGCSSLTELDLSNFSTANVTRMEYMFNMCTSLKRVDVSHFDTSNVVSMESMFNNCSSLTELDLSSFNTQNVTYMTDMFYGCTSLKKVTVGRNFSFKPQNGAGCTLPAGNWYSARDKKVYTSEQIANRQGVDDTYEKVEAPVSGNEPESGDKPSSGNNSGSGNNSSSGNNSGSGNNTGSGNNSASGNNANNGTTESMTIYRLYNPYTGEHLFTKDKNEYDTLKTYGWRQEGLAWIAPVAGDVVYRLYNRYSGEHLYTTSKTEYDNLEKVGWKKEGTAWYSGGSTSVYRLFNPYETIGTHHYTTSATEYANLKKVGWRQEGVGWKALSK